MTGNEIYKIYGTDFLQMTKELLEEADLMQEIGNADKRIGIKPNLVAPSESSWGGTTHSEIVAGIIEYLQEHGVKNIVMMEGSWVGDKTSESMVVCGYDQLVEKYQVPFLDMQKDSYQLRDCKGLELAICDSVFNVDFLINVPVLKGHCQTKMTCALKNLKGLLPNKEKRHFHAMGLHKPIAHLNAGVHQDFVVVDNICGDLDFEDGGNPVVRNCIMAGKDALLMDCYCAQLLHIEVSEIPYLVMAAELGVGNSDLTKVEAKLCKRNEGYQEPVLPKAYKVVELQDMVEEVESCSACYGYFLPALQMLKEEGLFDKLDTKICIGQGYRGKTGKLGVGNCTSGFEYCIKGCPPVESKIYEELKEYILSNMKEEHLCQ